MAVSPTIFKVQSFFIHNLHIYLENKYNSGIAKIGIISLVMMSRTLLLYGIDLINEIIKQWEILGITIDTQPEINQIMPTIIIIIRTTRTWRCRGHVDKTYTTNLPWIDAGIDIKINRNEFEVKLCLLNKIKLYFV